MFSGTNNECNGYNFCKTVNGSANNRNTVIEALRIIAMCGIVASHVVLDLMGRSFDGEEWTVNFSQASLDPTMWVLVIIRTLGPVGNVIFITCSAWFLAQKDSTDFKKVFSLISNNSILSILILIVFLKFDIDIPRSITIRCLFPTINANNWFLTCYLIVYALHPFINTAIREAGKSKGAQLCAVSTILWIIIPSIHPSLMWSSRVTNFITIYILVCYEYYYFSELANDLSLNLKLLSISVILLIASIIITEILGVHISILNGQALHWSTAYNPFVVVIGITLFNIAKLSYYQNDYVNIIASAMLIVYLIHENILVSGYFCTYIWKCIYDAIGYNYLITIVIAYTITLFFICTIIAVIYKRVVWDRIDKVSGFIYKRIAYIYDSSISV